MYKKNGPGRRREWRRWLACALVISITSCDSPPPGNGGSDNDPPTVSVSDDQSVDAGAVVTLDASGSTDPEGDAITFRWEQKLGSAVTLSSTTEAVVTFTAPSTGALLEFEVAVSDGETNAFAETRVTVSPPVEESARVVERAQPSVRDDPAVTGDFPNGWTLGPPVDEIGAGEEEEEESEFEFAPLTELDLAPGATGEIEFEVFQRSGLAGSVRWIGTLSPLTVTLLLDNETLSTGRTYSFGKDRGGSYLEGLAETPGIARLAVVNTTNVTVKVRLALGAKEIE